MATRTVFSDNDNNELDCYLNDKGKVFISVGQPSEDIAYNGFITLSKKDVNQLIKILSELKKEMTE
jgi:glycosyltransferase involved in cell wall biosynthesis